MSYNFSEDVLDRNPELRELTGMRKPVVDEKPVVRMNKYNAKKTYNELCGRVFDSRGESERASELRLMELAGEIHDLKFQVKYVLCEEPKITVTLDFEYMENGEKITEDFKGVLTRESRVKYAWLKQRHGITVKIHRK